MANERVDYNQIEDEVSNLTDLASNIDSASDSIKSSIDSIKSAWEGSAAEAYVGEIEKLSNNLPDAVRQLAEATYFLASCSDNFQEIEESLGNQLRELIGEDYIKNYDASKEQNADIGSRLTIDDVVKKRKEQPVEPETEELEKEKEAPGLQEIQYEGSYNNVLGTIGGPILQASNQNGKKENESETENKLSPLKDGESVKIPEDIKQGDYKTSLYEDNKFEANSLEEKLQKMWKNQENNEKDNLATIKVNDEDRYLVTVSPKYGNVGDNIDVNLKDGTVVKCVIAGNLDIKETSTNIYGIEDAKGNTSIVNFQMVDKNAKVKYAWDENSPITKITNRGNHLNLDTTTKIETAQITNTQTEASTQTETNTKSATTEAATTTIDNTETKQA